MNKCDHEGSDGERQLFYFFVLIISTYSCLPPNCFKFRNVLSYKIDHADHPNLSLHLAAKNGLYNHASLNVTIGFAVFTYVFL